MIFYRSASRLTAFVLTALWISQTEYLQFEYGFFAFLFCHFTLALVFSHKQIKQVFSRPPSAVKLLGFMALGLALMPLGFDIQLYFIIHFIFSDVYAYSDLKEKLDPELAQDFSAARMFYTIAITLLAVHSYSLLNSLPAIVLICASVLGFAYVSWVGSRMRSSVGNKAVIDLLLFEAIGLTFAFLAYQHVIYLNQLIAYHLVLWFFLPMPKLLQRGGSKKLTGYIAATALLTSGYLLLTPLIHPTLTLGIFLLLSLNTIGGFFHITHTFALSPSNPQILRRVFS